MIDTAPRRRSTATEAVRESTESTGGPPVLDFERVTRTFGGEPAVEGLSLSVYEGELLTLLGPSGCGKTTTLRLLAGLERPDSGDVVHCEHGHVEGFGLDREVGVELTADHELAWFRAD